MIEGNLSYCGYYALISSEQMKASEALNLYKSRDASEKLLRGDKSYLGDKSMWTYVRESTDNKNFVEFVALIIRNRMHKCLKDMMRTMDKRPEYMTVPAALRELEKIEMVRLTDTKYHLDYAVTATQKEILEAFGLDAQNVKYWESDRNYAANKGGRRWQEPEGQEKKALTKRSGRQGRRLYRQRWCTNRR